MTRDEAKKVQEAVARLKHAHAALGDICSVARAKEYVEATVALQSVVTNASAQIKRDARDDG